MTTTEKRLVLAYPPYCTATAPPMGVYFLKGFLTRTLADWSVKVLDLNLLAHQEALSDIADKVCQGGERLTERVLTEAAVSRAAEVFRGQHPREFYDRPDRCNLYGSLWGQIVPSRVVDPARLQKAFRQEAPMPEQIQRYAQRVLREQPTLVGISICYNDQLWAGLCLAKEIKARADVPVIAGGTLFNVTDPEFLATLAPHVDYVVSGEGERPLLQILSGAPDLETTPGVICLGRGQTAATPAVFEENLDLLGEADYSDADLRAYYSPLPVLPIFTSRGCYWRRCAFCAHYKSAGQTYRRRSIPNVIQELKRHADNGISHFCLIDEMIAPAHFSELADAILQAGLKIHYYAMTKPVRQFSPELLDKMHRSGCRYLLWGVESGSQRILDLMDKGTRVPDIETVLDAAAHAGIKNHVFVMFGFPTETKWEMQATLDLLTRHKPAIAMAHRGLFQLEPGTPAFDHPDKFSITRTWPADTPGLYRFECSSGMTRQEAQQSFAQNIMFLRSFASPLPELGDFRFRDHLLLIYSNDVAASPG
jgi:hypothetical protein